MKLKIISLAYIFLFGSFCLADDVFLSGGFSLTPESHFTAFNERTVKIQPAVHTGAFFYIGFSNFFKAGLSGNFLYAFNSNLNGGWSYPGFSGLEAGVELRGAMPFLSGFELGLGGGAGWYRYNLTENYFFLPFISLTPSFPGYNFSGGPLIYFEIPIKYYFHRQAEVFMSAGLALKAEFR